MNEARADRERAINEMDRKVNEAVTYFRSQVTADNADWGPKEVISHILAWHKWTVDSVEGVRSGQAPLRQPPTMTGVDEFNAAAVRERSGQNMADLANELAALQRQLVSAVRALPDPTAIVVIRLNGDELTAAQRLEMMNHHISSHLDELRLGE